MTAAHWVQVPLRLDSLANFRGHWSKKARIVKAQREYAYLITPARPLPCTVTLTRIAPRLLDGDNLVSAFKAVRDGIADRLGVKDNDPRVTWQYRQERGNPKQYAVQIEVRPDA